MSITDKLLSGIRTKDIEHPYRIADIAGHPANCPCSGCKAFEAEAHKAMIGFKATAPAPTVAERLAQSFKAVVHDSGGRTKPSGHTVTEEDEDGRGKRKRLPIDKGLAGSMNAILGRKD